MDEGIDITRTWDWQANGRWSGNKRAKKHNETIKWPIIIGVCGTTEKEKPSFAVSFIAPVDSTQQILHTYNLLILYFPKTLHYIRLQTFLRSSIMQHLRILNIVPQIPHKFVCLSCCYYWLQKIKIYCFRFDSGDITLY